NLKGITISGARYASEDAATLVNYVIALLEYSRLCVPLRAAKERVEIIKHEKAEFERRKMERENESYYVEKYYPKYLNRSNIETNAKQEESLTEDDLPRLLRELEELQTKFDASAVNKHKLHIELESCIQRMDAATSIIESPSLYEIEMNPNMVCLTNLEDQWKKWIDEHLSHEQTITNCIITAAYICYCGPFDLDTRNRLGRFFAECCSKHEIPREPQQIFKNFTLPEFLFTPIQLKEIQLLRLPGTENILENGCFLIEDRSYDSWPLICDSSRRSIDWLKTYNSDKQLFITREHEMKSVLETCLSEGHFLLLTDCDVSTIMSNRKIETVLRNKNRFLTSDKPFKLNLGNQEIECNPKFRLFLHTGNDTTEIPDHLAAYTLVINFKLVRADLEEELLDRFLQLAKPRIDSERYGLLQEKVNTLKIIDPLEQDITNFLASEVDLLNSVEPTKRLSDLKKSYDEAVDSNMRIELAEEPLIKTRESYREIALRGAICYDVISCLKEINSNYILSFKQFVEIFDDALYQFERSSTPQVISKLTSRVFACLSRMMTESDRKLFSILLSMEIEASAGRLKIGEREFVISPLYGAMMVQSITNKQMIDHKHWQAKKPFDWMSEEQFLNLQYLAVSHSWFNDPFDRMARDGWETQWRSLCESETPETVALPDKLDEVLTPIQRFCIVRAVRGDRILQIALAFVACVLGKSFVSSNSVDLDSMYAESSAQKPIILMYQEESETIRRYFSMYAKSKVGSNFSIIDINSLGSGGEKQIKRTLLKPMEEGSWVLLLNCHNSSKVLNQIESLLVDSTHKNLDSNFRCWISLLQSDNKPPTSLMLNSVRAFIGPALTVKENIIRSFSWIDSEQVKISNKPEWPILLHNLCYFHSCLKLRSRYTRCGWNSPYTLNFTTEEFLESLRTAVQEYLQDSPSRNDSVKSVSDSNKNISLQSIKFVIADLIYGSSASNEYDLQAIESIAEYWISSIANRKDFELTKLKYKIPSAFSSQPVKLGSLQQSLENIPPLQLEAPEACHLLPSIETVLGDDVFIMTRLSKLIDNLSISPTMAKVYDRPLTPFDNSVVPQINSNSTNPILYAYNTFSTSSYMASQNKKYNDLNEYCTMILTTKIPKTYSKDQINDRVKKTGGWSSYNYWIVNEMNLISNLINTIKNHVQIIKNATESKKLGWDLSQEVLEVADSLYHNQIPKSWCLLSGSESHFVHYALGSFLNDLTVRFQHIDKCLSMSREKNPAFNLGAYYYPQNLLSLFKFETLKTKNQAEDFGCVEPLVFQTEMTSRDKEHLRDPPKEGMFVYGLYLWGCHWEKSTSELVDQPVKFKEGNMPLPVIHLTCWLESEKPLLNDSSKSQDLYKCPVYPNRNERDQSVFEIDLMHAGVPASKWAMRGVCATLKPY
ncbi:unnamed protein product, partial [Brachionus calyciflorus]